MLTSEIFRGLRSVFFKTFFFHCIRNISESLNLKNYCVISFFFKNYSIFPRGGLWSLPPRICRYCFLNIFNICFFIIPDLLHIGWREKYTDVNFTINNIVMTFIKNWNINSMIWNNTLVGAKYKINKWHRVVYNMRRLIYNLIISSW